MQRVVGKANVSNPQWRRVLEQTLAQYKKDLVIGNYVDRAALEKCVKDLELLLK